MKAPSPLLGYNNNVRHKNRVFHVQTEDSGVKHPHVITHLFMDGGRILKSVKTSYAEHVGKDKLGDIVRQMMKEQHKAMFRALRDGEFDRVVDDAVTTRKSEPAIVAPKIVTRSIAASVPEEAGPATVRDLPPDEVPPLTLDFDGAADAGFQPTQDLPPPPANVLGARGAETGTGRYRTVEERERAPLSSRRAKSERPPRTDKPPQPARKSERPMARSDRPAPRKSDRPREGVRGAVREERGKRVNDPRAEPPSEPKQPIAGQSARPGPHTSARPAAAFGQARPQQSSIFGEDIISDKSLDEVILSYLAEDLEDGSK
jgi:hypothetical protein